MATIKLKNGSGAPLASDLVQGEPALDLTNKRLYTEDAGGAIIEVGTNPSSITTSSADIDGGSIDGTVIGGVSPAAVTTTALVATTADIDGGSIDGAVIGGTTPAAGSFTTFTSTGIDDNAASTAMTLDSSGNVGIGVANGDVTNDGSAARTYVGIIGTANRGRLNIGTTASNGADAATLAFTNGANTLADIIVDTTSGVQNTGNLSISSTDYLRVLTSGSERMRIDASGNLLVGNTVADPATSNVNGASITAGGEVIASLNGVAAQFNRRTSDGDIAAFKKGGATVGSIGVLSNRLYIGNGDTGLKFSGADDLISPIDASSGTGRDGLIDLGSSGARFKDIYLSGTVNAGGGTVVSSGSNAFSSKAVGGYAIQAYQDATSADHTALDLRSDSTTSTRFLIRGYNNAAVTPAEVFSVGADGSAFFNSNVGIGTSSPSSVLHLSTSNDPQITLTDTGFGASADITGSNGNLRLNSQTATIFDIADSEVMRIDSSGKVGIGTGLPNTELHLLKSGSDADVTIEGTGTGVDARLNLYANSTGVSQIRFGDEADTNTGLLTYDHSDDSMFIRTNNSEAMRIDSSGNLLVGTSAVSSQATGVSSGVYFVVKGDIVPSVDAGITGHSDLGDPSTRFEDAYIRDGVTTGSDGRDKQDIEELSAAEQRVAVACKGLLRKWRWIDAVEAKGADARIHFGIIAQDLQDAFTAEGLDAGRYAMLINSTWTDEETGEERSRMGVRYSELLAFILAAI